METQVDFTSELAEAVLRDINKTEGKFFSITFFKKDGSLRTMTCRTEVTKGVNGKGLKFDAREYDLKPVWCLDKQAWRMINLAYVVELTFGNKTIQYT